MVMHFLVLRVTLHKLVLIIVGDDTVDEEILQTKFHTKTDKYASLNVQQSNKYYKKFVESRGTMESSSTGSTSNAGAGSTGYSSNRANVNALGRKAQRQKTRLNFVFVGIPFFMVIGFLEILREQQSEKAV